jgi:biotin-(acetyl-CoA carboxylase) ligase
LLVACCWYQDWVLVLLIWTSPAGLKVSMAVNPDRPDSRDLALSPLAMVCIADETSHCALIAGKSRGSSCRLTHSGSGS